MFDRRFWEPMDTGGSFEAGEDGLSGSGRDVVRVGVVIVLIALGTGFVLGTGAALGWMLIEWLFGME